MGGLIYRWLIEFGSKLQVASPCDPSLSSSLEQLAGSRGHVLMSMAEAQEGKGKTHVAP